MEERTLNKKDLNSMFWRSMFSMSSINYERFQALGFCFSIIPAIRKLYKDKQSQSEALKRHMRMYNSHPWMMDSILGTVAALEEQNAKGEEKIDDMIDNVKVGLMGPFAGIGDSLFWGTLRPLLAGIGASLALEGSLLGPIFFLVVWNAVNFGFRYYSLTYGYKLGLNMLQEVGQSNIIQKVSEGASVLGLMVLGVLVASWVRIETPIQFKTGETVMKLQDVLNGIMPSMLPLIVTMIIVYLLRKNISSNKILIGIFIVSFITSALRLLV